MYVCLYQRGDYFNIFINISSLKKIINISWIIEVIIQLNSVYLLINKLLLNVKTQTRKQFIPYYQRKTRSTLSTEKAKTFGAKLF